MHPRMFSHLAKLNYLHLRENTCIYKSFNPVTSLAAIENELATCGANYLVSLTDLPRKLELLTQLFYNVDERNEENAAEIKEIKKMVEKIWDMLNTK
jgi:hypothetical protein